MAVEEEEVTEDEDVDDDDDKVEWEEDDDDEEEDEEDFTSGVLVAKQTTIASEVPTKVKSFIVSMLEHTNRSI